MNKLSNPPLCFYKHFNLNSVPMSWWNFYILKCCALHCKFICKARCFLTQGSICFNLLVCQAKMEYVVDPLGATYPCVTKASDRMLELLVCRSVQTIQSSSQLDSKRSAGRLTELLTENECRLTGADTPPKSTSSNLRQINNSVMSKSHVVHGRAEPKCDWGPGLKRLIEQASQRLRRACQTAEIWLQRGSRRCGAPIVEHQFQTLVSGRALKMCCMVSFAAIHALGFVPL